MAEARLLLDGLGFPESTRWHDGRVWLCNWGAGDVVAVTVDGENFALVNASPDLRQQIIANSPLHPRRGLRDSPIRSVIVTNADVDHVLRTSEQRSRRSKYRAGDRGACDRRDEHSGPGRSGQSGDREQPGRSDLVRRRFRFH